MGQPKIAFIDIETAPSLGFYFDPWKENNIISTKTGWYILSFAVKWQGQKRTRTYALPDYPLYKKNKEDDKSLVQELHRIFDQADILVAHNGDRFDIRKSNARFIQHGLEPPAHYKSIDTLKIARRVAKFDSNRLDSLGQALGVGKKLPNTGVHLWLGCMAGVPSAWRMMRKYNARDVELLERVYLKLRPWAPNHPNLNLYTNAGSCPTCQSRKFKLRGINYGKAVARQRYQCASCGTAWSGERIEHEASTARKTTQARAQARAPARVRGRRRIAYTRRRNLNRKRK